MHLVGFTAEIYYDAWSYKPKKVFTFFFVKYMIVDAFNKYNSHGNTPFKLQRALRLEKG